MDILDSIQYFASLRAGRYDLLAVQDLEDERKRQVAPVWSLRGSKPDDLMRFADRWGNTPFWLDVSRFPQDAMTAVAAPLNNPADNFQAKAAMFSEIRGINDAALPVVGFSAGDPVRAVTQFGLKMLDEFPLVALRIECYGQHLREKLAHARAFLNAVSDADLARVVLIADYAAIDGLPALDAGSDWAQVCTLLSEYKLAKLVTLSTSWPEARPDRNESSWAPCYDPFWQAHAHDQVTAPLGTQCFYGDYAGTNPIKDILDFQPKVMALPIPYAGYFNPYAWYQERRGRSGENECFREIAAHIQALDHYRQYGAEFCWGTREITAIASGARASPGNAAHWNRIRVNQHISAMLEVLNNNGLADIVNGPHNGDDDDDQI